MQWTIPNIWQNSDCWIIGGGSSITEQFNIPKNIVDDVKAGTLPISAYSEYLVPLHDEKVIGVNGAYLLGNWVDVCFFGDKDWMFEHKARLEKFPGLVVGCAEVMKITSFNLSSSFKFVPKDTLKRSGISDVPQSVCWNKNSGGAAISLAVHLGVKRIYLLGFDMDFIDGDAYWHRMYEKNKEHWLSKKEGTPFHIHIPHFDSIARDAKKLGVEIINCSPNSKIEVFQKMSVKEVLCQKLDELQKKVS